MIGTKLALKYVIDLDPTILQSWQEDRNRPLVHMAFTSNNIEVLDALLYEYGFEMDVRNEYVLN